jgi:hypothetical protein
MPPRCVQEILTACNAGQRDALSAAQRLHWSPAQLYRLRHPWRQAKAGFAPQPSGGEHTAPWPPAAPLFLTEILPHSQPLDFALLADERARRVNFHRSRAAGAA